jgi:hypothetical protein
MQLFLVTTLTAAILILVPIIGSGTSGVDMAGSQRETIVYKNQRSPTLQELGRKAGDPAQAGVPERAPELGSRRTGQWI